MKRIYACILIVAALLGVSLYSSGRVQGFAQDISADLDCALEAVRLKDFPTARQALAEGAELCDTESCRPPQANFNKKNRPRDA